MSLAKKHLMLLTLLAGMIFSQFAFAVHQIDFTLHDNESGVCNICLHASSDADVLHTDIQLPLWFHDTFDTQIYTSSYFASSFNYHSRAPPHI